MGGCVRKKRFAVLSKKDPGTSTLEKVHSKGGSLTPVNFELKSYTLSTDLVDFNARLVGSANPPKYDIAVYSNKVKAIVHEPNAL
jgi:hypothetical protein